VRFNGYRITPSDLDEAKEEWTAKRNVPETINHSLKCLRRVLHVIALTGKPEKNPFPNFDMPKVSQGRTRFLTLEEEATVLKALGQPYA
jgi:hypothetical protein